MHWVDRGPEPDRLEPIRTQYTPRWVRYHEQGDGSRPTDARWREFHDDIAGRFSDLCGYCEETSKGEVDHFQPKSRYPRLTYEWSNWIFACHDCNQLKSGEWPSGGYVDPCAKSGPARPEHFFTFDTLTGEIEPRPGLTPGRRRNAAQMIDDLRLNDHHHLRKRTEWMWLVAEVLPIDPGSLEPADVPKMNRLVARDTQLSSITRTLLAERGYSVD